ncbi:ABC-type Fe3+-hydroxamate transport system substrate-binding protein [Maribacter vaceletii]|uniref:ABC-type Fe3+-hydroxamate transport system substrate-binding protein n=1 Tax=Maribacter vaceletii TaxID=1206816 RepID=A0A495DTA1_9FLAO|nr:helical backbone metal receptor [Maribacter vaceletii]RKR07854.1 ABC-type Fe3+-hydroxamate transport system substrate-binding protein [Maribacter vaceletii]
MVATIKDQLSRTIVLPSWPFRIISLVPSETELLVDLGLEEYIVGITKFCVHPNHLRQNKEIVGGTKNISFEKIRDLNPNIILCNKEENTKEIVNTLEKEYEVHVSDVKNIADVFDLIKQYQNLFNCKEKASKITTNIKSELASFQKFIQNKPKVSVLYFIWKTPWMLAGKDTFINSLLAINKFTNLTNNQERYPTITSEEIKQTTAQLILLSSEPYPFSDKHISEIKKLAISSTITLVDGEYFSWYGSRLQAAFTYFKKLHLTINQSKTHNL